MDIEREKSEAHATQRERVRERVAMKINFAISAETFQRIFRSLNRERRIRRRSADTSCRHKGISLSSLRRSGGDGVVGKIIS